MNLAPPCNRATAMNDPHKYNALSELRNRHSTWYRWALIYAALATVCLAAGLIDERHFQGVSVWHKPFKFALSFSMYFATLGWLSTLMLPGYFNDRRGKLLTFVPVVCAFLEMLYILIQGARGEASHFNESTVFYSVMYSLMGVGAVLLVLTCAWIGGSILRHHALHDVWVLSVGIGLIATCILGGGFGFYLSNSGGHWVGGEASDIAGLPLVNWSTTGGDLRVAHFFGMHSMQIIPIIGATLKRLQQRNRINGLVAQTTLISICLAFSAFCSSTFLQALRGAPLV